MLRHWYSDRGPLAEGFSSGGLLEIVALGLRGDYGRVARSFGPNVAELVATADSVMRTISDAGSLLALGARDDRAVTGGQDVGEAGEGHETVEVR
jgi:hypothetical protein